VNIAEPEVYQYSVMCLLSNLEKFQRIYVARTGNVDPPIDIKKLIIPDANVKVLWGDEEIKFQYALIDSFSYSEVGKRLKVLPGEKYKLVVDIPDGGRITGEAIVPGAFKIIEPSPRDTFKVKRGPVDNVNIKLAWRESNNSYGYMIKVSGDAPRPLSFISKFVRDTSITINLRLWERESDLINVAIKVYAVDKNFYHHVIGRINSAGVENAYGFFASSFGDSVRVVLVR
jgi:hypothetical protein